MLRLDHRPGLLIAWIGKWRSLNAVHPVDVPEQTFVHFLLAFDSESSLPKSKWQFNRSPGCSTVSCVRGIVFGPGQIVKVRVGTMELRLDDVHLIIDARSNKCFPIKASSSSRVGHPNLASLADPILINDRAFNKLF